MQTGALDPLILKTVARRPDNGYGIAQGILRHAPDALRAGHGQLYPALHRLEQSALLAAAWAPAANGHMARVYRLTPRGQSWLKAKPRHSPVALPATFLLLDTCLGAAQSMPETPEQIQAGLISTMRGQAETINEIAPAARINAMPAYGISPGSTVAIGRLRHKHSKEIRSGLQHARKLLQAGKAVEANRELAALAVRDDACAELHLLLGVSYAKSGDALHAEEHLRRAIALDPGFVAARFDLAVLLLEQGRSTEAGQAAREVLRLAPGDPQAQRLLAALPPGI